MRQKIVVSAIVLLLTVLVPVVGAQEAPTVFTESPTEMMYDLNTYTETRIIVSYEFTEQVVGNVSSAGKNKWKQSNEPFSSEFETDVADRFTWTLNIRYTETFTQRVTVSVFSGNEAVDRLQFTITSDDITLEFNILATEQPEYPTAEQVADKAIEVLDNRMMEYTAEIRDNNAATREHISVMWIIVILSFSVSILVFVFYKRKEAQQ